ncbi:hypothetical protein ScPMuIL_016553 [Solemya velum]
MVRKSFLKCGIANSMDGSEDDELFNDFLQSSREECVAADPDPAPESDDDDDNYTVTEKMTEDDFHELFGHSDDEPVTNRKAVTGSCTGEKTTPNLYKESLRTVHSFCDNGSDPAMANSKSGEEPHNPEGTERADPGCRFEHLGL